MNYEIMLPQCNLQTVFDGRGGIFTFLPKDAILEFNLLYFNAGALRGNHFHPEFTEYFLVTDGSGVMVFKLKDGSEDVIHMAKGSCTRAQPGLAHAFHAITAVTAISMLSKPWDSCETPIVNMQITPLK